ncbi:MAG: nucleoside deaminase [Brevinematales bacterium]|nr:nucleoside deaminase [Brevinematales bacterium]
MENTTNWDEYFSRIYDAILGGLQNGKGGPFGAGIVSGGILSAIGTNNVLGSMDVSRHAEVEALSCATSAAGMVHLTGSILLTSHFPCMMCYHAVKWADIRECYYIFDTNETRDYFGFEGDLDFLSDLSITNDGLQNDPRLKTIRYNSPVIDELFRNRLVQIWNENYKARLGGYDI